MDLIGGLFAIFASLIFLLIGLFIVSLVGILVIELLKFVKDIINNIIEYNDEQRICRKKELSNQKFEAEKKFSEAFSCFKK